MMKISMHNLFAVTDGMEPVFSETASAMPFSRYVATRDGWMFTLDQTCAGSDAFSVASIRGPEKEEITLLFDSAGRRDDGCILARMNGSDEQYLVVLPVCSRRFDEHARICLEQECRATVTDQSLTIYPGDLSCCFNVFRSKTMTSILSPGLFNIERRAFSLYGSNSIKPLCLNDFLIDGRIYDPRRHKRAGSKRICQEQVAYLLHGYYAMLWNVTGKPLYRAMQTMIVYAVALRMQKSNTLPHGAWTDSMETHLRYAAEALDVLTARYRECGGDMIADKCGKISQIILNHCDEIENNGLWFLHDTIEKSAETAMGYPALVASRAFGKSPGNTLTVNTHICSLMALQKYALMFNDDKALACVKRAEDSLSRVMTASGGCVVFRLLYFAHDAFWKCDCGAVRVFVRILHRCLLLAKKRWPRLVMPNGAIERDLSASSFSRRYHIVNARDILKLMSVCGMPWIHDVALGALKYAKKQRLDECDIAGYPGGEHWAGTALKALALEQSEASRREMIKGLSQYRDALEKAGLFWPVDAVVEFPLEKVWYSFFRDLDLRYDFFCFNMEDKRCGLLLGASTGMALPSGVEDESLSSGCFAVWNMQ